MLQVQGSEFAHVLQCGSQFLVGWEELDSSIQQASLLPNDELMMLVIQSDEHLRILPEETESAWLQIIVAYYQYADCIIIFSAIYRVQQRVSFSSQSLAYQGAVTMFTSWSELIQHPAGLSISVGINTSASSPSHIQYGQAVKPRFPPSPITLQRNSAPFTRKLSLFYRPRWCCYSDSDLT